MMSTEFNKVFLLVWTMILFTNKHKKYLGLPMLLKISTSQTSLHYMILKNTHDIFRFCCSLVQICILINKESLVKTHLRNRTSFGGLDVT